MTRNQKAALLISIGLAFFVVVGIIAYFNDSSSEPVRVKMAMEGKKAEEVDVRSSHLFETNGRDFVLTILDGPVLVYINRAEEPITYNGDFLRLKKHHRDISSVRVVAKK